MKRRAGGDFCNGGDECKAGFNCEQDPGTGDFNCQEQNGPACFKPSVCGDGVCDGASEFDLALRTAAEVAFAATGSATWTRTSIPVLMIASSQTPLRGAPFTTAPLAAARTSAPPATPQPRAPTPTAAGRRDVALRRDLRRRRQRQRPGVVREHERAARRRGDRREAVAVGAGVGPLVAARLAGEVAPRRGSARRAAADLHAPSSRPAASAPAASSTGSAAPVERGLERARDLARCRGARSSPSRGPSGPASGRSAASSPRPRRSRRELDRRPARSAGRA